MMYIFLSNRPNVDEGKLRFCERPRDGATCNIGCNEKGFSDIRTIKCHLEGNKTIKKDGKDFHPYKWTVGKAPGNDIVIITVY